MHGRASFIEPPQRRQRDAGSDDSMSREASRKQGVAETTERDTSEYSDLLFRSQRRHCLHTMELHLMISNKIESTLSTIN